MALELDVAGNCRCHLSLPHVCDKWSQLSIVIRVVTVAIVAIVIVVAAAADFVDVSIATQFVPGCGGICSCRELNSN